MNKIINYFLLTRPYTIPSIALIAFLTQILTQNHKIENTIISITLAVLIWATVNLLSESVQKDAGRITVNKKVPLTMIIISVILIILKNAIALTVYAFIFFSAIIYALKSKKLLIGKASFLFRGFIELGIILLVFLLNHSLPNQLIIISFIIPIYFITVSRNIVGDLRDYKIDKYTIIKKYGLKFGKLLVLLFALIAIVLMPSILISFPIIFALIITLLKRNQYQAHKFFVLSTFFTLVNYLAFYIKSEHSLYLINLIYLGFLFLNSYDTVPREIK